MNKKIYICVLLKAGRHAKAGRFPEGVPQNHIFQLIFEQKSLKTAEKSSLTSFWCAQHPKAGQNTQQ